ncbi:MULTISPECIES: acyl-CoA thioesterase [Citricoccus]|uniref:acyl-CoA thioesterase n=1 Tax=Citricoccus TaxID=169133 RepID=UPI000255DEED|nr:thioesterase family protein [Citricoccus sp. CH26A]
MTERYLSIPLELRWSDQDLMGHVNNAKIVTLAEEARIRFQIQVERLDAVAEPESVGGRVVARQVIDYHRPVRYGQLLEMRVGVLRVGTSSFTLRHQGVQDGRPVFTVDAVVVVVSADGSSRPLTDAERAGLEDWRWPEDAGAGTEEPRARPSATVASGAGAGTGAES